MWQAWTFRAKTQLWRETPTDSAIETSHWWVSCEFAHTHTHMESTFYWQYLCPVKDSEARSKRHCRCCCSVANDNQSCDFSQSHHSTTYIDRDFKKKPNLIYCRKFTSWNCRQSTEYKVTQLQYDRENARVGALQRNTKGRARSAQKVSHINTEDVCTEDRTLQIRYWR